MLFGKNNKKGQFSSILLALTIIFMFMIISITCFTIWTSYNAEFRPLANDFSNNDTQLNANLDKIDYLMTLPNKLFIFIILSMWISLIVSSIYTSSDHPVFFLFWLFLTMIITLIALVLRNIGVKYLNQPILIASTNSNQIIAFMMNYFHWISLFLCISFGLVYYGKNFFGGGTYNQP